LFIYSPIPRCIAATAQSTTASIATFVNSPSALNLRHFGTSTLRNSAQPAVAMDDFEDSFEREDYNDESDAFTPEKKPKKAAVKKTTTAKTAVKKTDKADKPKAPAKPRAKKQKVAEPLDEPSLDFDRSFSVLETPQSASEFPTPPRPPVLQEQNDGPKKNASETYQKVHLHQSNLTIAHST
jgi:hypothetical protein